MLLPVYDAIEYARSKTVACFASSSRFGDVGFGYPRNPRSMRSVSTVKSTTLYVRRFFGFRATGGGGGGAGMGVSAPEQSSSMPFPGMSIAPGLIFGSSSLQSPPPNRAE